MSVSRIPVRCLIVAVAIALLPASVQADQEETFTVSAVQFSVNSKTVTDLDHFRRRAERLVATAVQQYDSDLVVFPEYINALLIAREVVPVIQGTQTLEEALEKLHVRYPEVADIEELFHLRSQTVMRSAMGIWRDLASRFEVAIVPGTFFVRQGTELRNRLVVINAEGQVIYQQDKVYLTEEEEELAGLEPGSLAQAHPLRLEGVDLALTICRDTYFDAWNHELKDADIWIDLRANGQLYSQEVRRRFDGALPERVEETAAGAGVSATLTGEFLDLLWQGPAFAVDADGRRVGESPSPVGNSLVVLEYHTVTGAIDVTVDALDGPR
jgi:predicted amidohydrolase